MDEFVDLDAVPLSLAWLKGHPKVLAAFGGPEHISGLMEAPFPHLEVTAGLVEPGDFAIRPVVASVQFTVWGSPTGVHGSAALRRLSMTAVGALREMLDAEYQPGSPVVSAITFSQSPSAQDLTNGKQRWQFTADFTMRPATTPAPEPAA